jgi:hypothetical protein
MRPVAISKSTVCTSVSGMVSDRDMFALPEVAVTEK